MNAVFADTSFYQALLNPGDQWHPAALNISRELRRPVITSDYVLCELGALMSQGLRGPVGKRSREHPKCAYRAFPATAFMW
jgi:predicted nucleic acid-binding protein